MGLLAHALLLSIVSAQDPPPAPPAPAVPLAVPELHPDVVLADDRDPVPLRSFGLGAGGIDEAAAPDRLRWTDDGCATSGGIVVQCAAAGVKLTFPSGRELLLAPDGVLHLRSGETAGPFPFGVELRLGDGSRVRARLAQAQAERLRDVFVVDGDRQAQPWRRGRPAREVDDVQPWAGVRLCCCGDGGDVYRAVALGPLVVLERQLVAKDREAKAPPERLVVLTAPLLLSLSAMPRQHTAPEPALRKVVTAVNATAERGSTIFPAGATLQRVEHDRLRWALRAGYELQLALDGPNAPRLCLYAGRAGRPMVEWTLLDFPAAFLANPQGDQPGAPRWHGNGTRLQPIATDLQARIELLEAGHALDVVKRLLR